MNLEHSFTVPVGIDEAWKILLDIETVGPCMPGASIDSVDGDDFTGTVKVKLGPIGLTYKGKASFVEKDESAHRAVIDARGRDSRGNGTAAAKVTATLSEADGRTTVQVDTDLDITGKPAQFGRGVMEDVGARLITQFADNLSQVISADPAPSEPAASEPAAAATPATPARKRTPRPKPSTASGTEVPSAVEPEVASEDTARAEGSTGGPIEEAALAAVADGPGAFGAPGSAAEPSANGTSTAPTATPTARPAAPRREAEPINLIESAGPAIAKRLAPVGVVVVLLVLLLRRRRRR
ncbi:SRPBCC family protein [Jatrophihabitans endophyticus]|uniref:SRPBCC family protein n=1 Tax=Jatrophihabitans endophyticus TaxID=1206085 RepID=UPI0019FF8A44|nr:SRPBCC family protein [Jatrophihabitans endophyticus]MBE7187225.1 SRPBCC family protein [Jatrophihabitans endophyticus]